MVLSLNLLGISLIIYLIGVVVLAFLFAIDTYIYYYKKKDYIKKDIQIRDLFETPKLVWFSWVGVSLYIFSNVIYRPLSNLIDKIGNITIIHKKSN